MIIFHKTHNSSELHPSRHLGLLPSDRTYYSIVKGKMVELIHNHKLQILFSLQDKLSSIWWDPKIASELLWEGGHLTALSRIYLPGDH